MLHQFLQGTQEEEAIYSEKKRERATREPLNEKQTSLVWGRVGREKKIYSEREGQREREGREREIC